MVDVHKSSDCQQRQHEKIIVAVFLLCIFAVLARSVHSEYFENGSSLPPPAIAGPHPVYYLFKDAPPPLHAPEAYRVAIPALGKFLVHITHVRDPSVVAAALDFLFGWVAAYLLYLTGTTRVHNISPLERAVFVASFLAAIELALPWVVYRQRPETMPTALFIALSLFCLKRDFGRFRWSITLLTATALQGFVRADVALILGGAIAVTSLRKSPPKLFGSRTSGLMHGIAMIVISLAIQGYLQLVRYPHLSYWPGPVVQIMTNIHLHLLASFFTALLPYFVMASVMYFTRIRITLDAIDTVVVTASVLYIPLWATVGLIDEVRIFVPFMMALSIVMAKFLSSLIADPIEADQIAFNVR